MPKTSRDVIINRLSRDFGVSKNEAKEMVVDVFKTLRNLLLDGYKVVITNTAEIKVNTVTYEKVYNVNTQKMDENVERLVPSIRLLESFKTDYKRVKDK